MSFYGQAMLVHTLMVLECEFENFTPDQDHFMTHVDPSGSDAPDAYE